MTQTYKTKEEDFMIKTKPSFGLENTHRNDSAKYSHYLATVNPTSILTPNLISPT